MKALQFHGPNDMRLVDVPVPEPAPGEVLVQVSAAGICHTDLAVLRHSREAFSSGDARFPLVPGHEWAGRVRAVGAGVTGLAPGDVVTGETGIGCGSCRTCQKGAHNCCPHVVETGIVGRDGAMREYHLHPAAFVHRLGNIPPHEGALVEPASVAVWACRRAQVRPGDRVAVCGGGSIGQLCLQAARAFGAELVMLTSRSQPKLDLALTLGASHVVNVDTEDLAARASDITQGDGFDVTLEAAGNAEALHDAVRITAPRGRVAVVGYAAEEPYGHSLARILGLELMVLGVRGSPGVWPETIRLVAEGKLRLGPLISHRFPLTEYQQAFELALRGGPDVLKVLLEP